MRKKVDLWIDLRSPYSFLAKDPAYDLERDFEAELRLRPFALDIAGAVNLGDPEAIARGMRKIKYFYQDARRFANQVRRRSSTRRWSISPGSTPTRAATVVP